MDRRWARLPLLVLVLQAGCPAPVTYNYAAEPDPRKKPYAVGIGDTIRVSVWRNADLSTDCVVRPDGTITLPLLGDLHAAGVTPAVLRDEVKRRLQGYVKDEDPVVTIAVTEVNSYRFTVSGSVFHGGSFAPGRYVTVLEAVAMAGGLTRFAKASELVINRTDSKGVRRIPVNYEEIAAGNRLEQNLVVLAGDTIYVP